MPQVNKSSEAQPTRTVNNELWAAYDAIGGRQSLVTWATEFQKEFYSHWIKMIVKEEPPEADTDRMEDIIVDMLRAGIARADSND